MRTNNGKVLVLGGGLAGPISALCLKNAGFEPVIYEPRAPKPGDGGYFLNMGPNGINLLRTLGLGAEIEKYGVPCGDVDFLNGRGRLIGTLNGSDQEDRFGAMCQVYKRGELQLALWDAVVSRGVQVEVGKQVASVTQTERDVAVQFADGTSAEGSLVLGCDGLHSPTRRSVFPEALEPYYTGLIGCAGYSRSSKISVSKYRIGVKARRAPARARARRVISVRSLVVRAWLRALVRMFTRCTSPVAQHPQLGDAHAC